MSDTSASRLQHLAITPKRTSFDTARAHYTVCSRAPFSNTNDCPRVMKGPGQSRPTRLMWPTRQPSMFVVNALVSAQQPAAMTLALCQVELP